MLSVQGIESVQLPKNHRIASPLHELLFIKKPGSLYNRKHNAHRRITVANLTGEEIGKYRITERIGRGGMAEVYLGVHTHLDRQVAIKVLHGYLLEGGDFLARFKREAKAVANLRHPNIVQVHDFDIQDDIIFMVMEYIDGTDLQSKLVELEKKGEHLSIKQIGSIIKDIAGALDYAHSKDMLHRDVKPSNILLDKNGKAYLTDFGIARLLSDQKFTATGTLIGTPAYMSPEQGKGEEVSRESDIYSLGVVAFELITGQVPFDAQTPIAIVQKQIADPIPDITKLVDDVPDAAQAVIETALAKAPESRFPSAEALVVALRGALEALEASDATLKVSAAPAKGEDEALFKPTVEMDDTATAPDLEKATVLMEDEQESQIEGPSPEKGSPPAEDPLGKVGEKKPSFFSSTRNKVIVGVGGIIVIAGIVFGPRLIGNLPPAEPSQSAEPTERVAAPASEKRGEEYFEDAHSLMKQARWTNAIEALDMALESGFENADVYGLRAYAKLNQGDRVSALDDFTIAIELNGNIFEYWRDRGYTKFELGDMPGALDDLNRALEINTVDPVAYRYRARVHSALDQVVEAINDGIQAAGLELENFENFLVLYEVYRPVVADPRQAEQVMELLDVAIELEPTIPEIRILRAEIFWFAWGDEVNALNEYNLAVEHAHPGWPVPFDRRGHFYAEIGRCDLAIEDSSRYIELDPENPFIYLRRGECFDQIGDIDLARADFVEVMIITTGIPEYEELRLRAQEWIDAHPE
jgi:serine/threonine protein kinase/tetratricopeptide (TPR) repeat protein